MLSKIAQINIGNGGDVSYNVCLQWHGTYRQKDRVYHEDIFFGRGKALGEVSAEELEQVGTARGWGS